MKLLLSLLVRDEGGDEAAFSFISVVLFIAAPLAILRIQDWVQNPSAAAHTSTAFLRLFPSVVGHSSRVTGDIVAGIQSRGVSRILIRVAAFIALLIGIAVGLEAVASLGWNILDSGEVAQAPIDPRPVREEIVVRE